MGFKEKIYLCVRKTHKHTLNRKKRSAEVRKRRCHGKGKMYERELNKNENTQGLLPQEASRLA